jgi:predicted nucleotidyltransferase
MVMTIQLPADFKEFLKLLNEKEVEYLLIGGYAVGYHGYPRPTGDMDIWIAISRENAEKIVSTLEEFIGLEDISTDLFLKEDSIVRMGVAPFKLEITTSIDGVTFDECYAERETVVIDGIEINLISLHHLKINKKASGRNKDLNDLENLP